MSSKATTCNPSEVSETKLLMIWALLAGLGCGGISPDGSVYDMLAAWHRGISAQSA